MSNTQPTNDKPTIEIAKTPGDYFADHYSYENVPQDNVVLFVGGMTFNSDSEAIEEAKKLNPNFNYVIVEQG